jgi:hypothetical protein
MVADSCLSFGVSCGTLFKGSGVVLAGFVLFIGSVYVLLAAVFGRWMAYLVLMIAFAGWMILQSSLWAFGFWAGGPDTKANLGPRGADPSWQVLSAGSTASSDQYAEFASYPSEETWTEGDPASADFQAAQGAATDFLAEQANANLGHDQFDVDAIQSTNFTVDSTRFATAEDGTSIAVVEAHFTAGGPETVLAMYHNSGSVPRYSWMFLIASILLFVIHLPLLDRAERSRKAFLTGGAAPPWYGPA